MGKEPNKPSQGLSHHQNAGIGQVRVGEPGAGPLQTAHPPSAGGPGTGSGDDAAVPAESDRTRRVEARDVEVEEDGA